MHFVLDSFCFGAVLIAKRVLRLKRHFKYISSTLLPHNANSEHEGGGGERACQKEVGDLPEKKRTKERAKEEPSFIERDNLPLIPELLHLHCAQIWRLQMRLRIDTRSNQVYVSV